MYQVPLTSAEFSKLMAPVSPSAGGFQSLLDQLQAKSSGKEVVVKSENLADKIIAYVGKYGRGGYQNRLKPIARFIEKVRAARSK
jgi:hypothetical protein